MQQFRSAQSLAAQGDSQLAGAHGPEISAIQGPDSLHNLIQPGTIAVTPQATFASLGLKPATIAVIPRSWTHPFPIQEQVIPLAIKGRDVIGLAETGAGKTGAFALPIIDDLMGKRYDGIKALVLNPVRELAAQTADVFQQLSRSSMIEVGLFRGGMNVSNDIHTLRDSRPQVAIGTLGRMAQLVRDGYLDLRRVETVVIDEADRMSQDFGTPEFETLMAGIPRSRQTLLFSATMPPHLLARVNELTRAAVTIDLGANRPPVTIKFEEYDVEGHRDKLPLFTTLIKERGFDRGVIFMNRKVEIDAVELLLREMGHDAWAVHHDRSQRYCEETLGRFKRGEIKFLVASDALQRGIDITGLPLVVNYDFPATYEDFTHRSGRTGRQGSPGRVISFVTYNNRRSLEAATGLYRDFQRNLDSYCSIERPEKPFVSSVLSPREIELLETAVNRAWNNRR